jgi:hypothetical protein
MLKSFTLIHSSKLKLDLPLTILQKMHAAIVAFLNDNLNVSP